ncbi:BNIP3 isoform 1 [Pan troglodytes]|nr:BCL2/adenovirus E1B 19 kDa protein-interacting protein 3 [Pan paniscus]XP_508116.2 BCL2/adenovirus E1B 19 kDa protein-interacting protein 3 [Pan troglodytes]EAW49143.1 BCL2/adenovirus E1B 19kDa interacting protein 3 [Homo sapiens]KAI2557663.1 BCL2 interacting protein 3 [Homo sapiens]KAI4077857.1 BCL2 interacting protein 3 [Homo sapiens]PNI12744.1 BNIP3 isoform 1 [Pan troglodytes]|eukprot:NP_004043.3 BCL2/adenovirus E1B 19 kDa protein-interacting protein 3 [Homo sapiens]
MGDAAADPPGPALPCEFLRPGCGAPLSPGAQLGRGAPTSAFPPPAAEAHPAARRGLRSPQLPSGAMSQNGAPGMQEESLQGSWVELHFSNNGNGGSVPASVSIYNGDMEKILLDAQHESGRSSSKSSHCDSPPRSQTPQDTNRASETDTHSIGEKNSSQSEEDDIERRKEVESILKKNSDWIWDWSSRPENIPPKEFLFKHPKRTATLSMRNTSVMKKGGIFSAEFLKVFLPSLLLSHLLAIGLGIYIGRRLTTSTSTF